MMLFFSIVGIISCILVYLGIGGYLAASYFPDNCWRGKYPYIFEDWLDDHFGDPWYGILNVMFTFILWPITVFLNIYLSYKYKKEYNWDGDC